jgi:hypothetical protein
MLRASTHERAFVMESAVIGAKSGMREFDAAALYEALNAERVRRGVSWRLAADSIWEQSAELNRQRRDHPISPSTLIGIAKRGDTTCQHALFMLRWLGRSPESFLSPVPATPDQAALPVAGPHHRLRWNLRAMYDALDARRRDRQLSWIDLAKELRCSQHQLTGIRTARYAIGMRLAMRIVQWLDCPASTFVRAEMW